MKYLLLAILLTTSVQAQDPQDVLQARIDSIDTVLEGIDSQLTELTELKGRLKSQRGQTYYELMSLSPASIDRAAVTVPYGLLYNNSKGDRATGMPPKTGYVTTYENTRFYYTGDDGRTGWIDEYEVNFESDPTAYILWLRNNLPIDARQSARLDKMAADYQRDIKRREEEAERERAREEARIEESRKQVAEWNRRKKEADEKAEEEKRLAEQRLADQEREARENEEWQAALPQQGIPAYIKSLTYNVNSAGGVEPTILVKNLSDQRIKYTTVEIAPFNSVGDPAVDTVNGTRTLSVRLVGPIHPEEVGDYSFGNNPPYYSNVATCFELHRLTIEFFDGTQYVAVVDLAASRWRDAYKIAGECAVK